jgi:tetratricopeptide (TPR) repeat protein
MPSEDEDDAYNAGVEHFRAGRLDAAIEAFTRAVTANPRDNGAWYNRGVCHAALAKAAGSVVAADDGLTVRGGPGVPHYARAIADYTQALALEERPHYLVNRASCHRALGDDERAIADYRRAAALGDPHAKAILATAYGIELP